MRKETAGTNVFAAIELEKKGTKQMLTVTLMRPLNMMIHEAIVLFGCLYLALAYAIFCKCSTSPMGTFVLAYNCKTSSSRLTL